LDNSIGFFAFVWVTCWGCSLLSASAEEARWVRRVQAHLTLQNPLLAVEEAEQALTLYPHSISLHEGAIRALAQRGEEKKFLQAWDRYVCCFPDRALNRELLEDMAWGVLQKAFQSSSILMREMALLAAFFGHDAKGVAILHQGMRDANYAVRRVAVKLAAHFRDQMLIDQVKRLFKEEKVWLVREEILEAIGKMRIVSLGRDLEGLIASDDTLPAEKALAISALLELLDEIPQIDVERLASSLRSGLRRLACQAIVYFQSLRDLDTLFSLAVDSHSDVRMEALQAIGQLRPVNQREKILTLARQSVQDRNDNVAISAAWLLTLYAKEEGQIVFQRLLHRPRRNVCILAAAALGATGGDGLPLTLYAFRSHIDPYVRLNLALGLIAQRHAVDEAAGGVKQIFSEEKKKWSVLEVGLFQAILSQSSNQASHHLINLDVPEVDDPLLRLQLLNILAILRVPKTDLAIRQYLVERSWKISAMAALFLLMEGDESAIKMVQELLHDSQAHVRLQAALLLSLWSREEIAIQVLEERYRESDREWKGRILEGIGRIGSMRSIPFLINVLREPSQTLRLIGAMAMIQCLNH